MRRPNVTLPVVFLLSLLGGLLGSLVGVMGFDFMLHRPLAPGDPPDDGTPVAIAILFVGSGVRAGGLGLGFGLIAGAVLLIRDEGRDLDESPYEALRRRPFN